MESKLRQLIKEYLVDFKMRGNSEVTVKGYTYKLSKFVLFVEKNDIDFLIPNPSHARMYRNHLVEAGLKPRSVNDAISVVKGFYDFLIEEGKISGNPINTRRLRVKEGQALPKFMTNAELELLNDWLNTIPEKIALGFRTMLATGMRTSEVVAVQCSDLIRLDNGGYIIRVRHDKGNKERYVPVMDADVARKLAEIKRERIDDIPLIDVTPIQYRNWSYKCIKQIGVHFYPHRCRHTVGTKLLQKGVAIDKVQEILGHENISTTRRYAKTAPEAVLELAAKADQVKETRSIYCCLLNEIFSENE
ncbi:tyrosine-type recombinase/integrase [Desulfoscipio sp. XC116]|uniref:tyrosine-type recombinase/integrase n=1 Tax=Desulfoscipio sp. XC116 TaxID=3144975 RepID=UPI00325AB16C